MQETNTNTAASLFEGATFGIKNYNFPTINPEAQNYVNSWAVFEDFKGEVKAINGTTFTKLKTNSEQLVARLDSLSKKLPDTLVTNAIFSRLIVAKTRAAMLQQHIQSVRPDSAAIQQSIQEMNVATTNLIIQINQKFLKDAIDVQRKDNEEKEVELQQKKIDSLINAEIKDRKKTR